MPCRGASRRGIALARLLLLAFVIAFVAYRFVQHVTHQKQHERREITIQRLLVVREALERYAVDNAGRFPPVNPGLQLLISPPPPDMKPKPLRWRGPYVPSPEMLLDGWGRPFHYCLGGTGDPAPPYQLWSNGADNSDGGTGMDADINVWQPDTLVP